MTPKQEIKHLNRLIENQAKEIGLLKTENEQLKMKRDYEYSVWAAGGIGNTKSSKGNGCNVCKRCNKIIVNKRSEFATTQDRHATFYHKRCWNKYCKEQQSN